MWQIYRDIGNALKPVTTTSGVDSQRRLHLRERLSRVAESISWVLLSSVTPHSGFHYCVQRSVSVNMILNLLPPNPPIVGRSNISRSVIQEPKLISVIALIFGAIVVWTLHSVVKLTRHKYSYKPPAFKHMVLSVLVLYVHTDRRSADTLTAFNSTVQG
jgi:hypothetical protein